MIPLTVGEIARLVSGQVHSVDAGVEVLDVVVDSRAVTPHSLYVAIAGERVDGHDYASAAVAAGSAVCLTSRVVTDSAGTVVPCIVVDDPVLALGRLARAVRRDRLGCKVVAITGSSGKTSTKDLLAQVLAVMGRTTSAVGSFNTEVGVPLTILSADADTEYLVVEMGMRGAGHIAYLVDIARPDVGAIINIGSAHVGMLGSREAIGDAKGELVAGLTSQDTAVLNSDDPIVLALRDRTPANVVTFGESGEADVRATDVRLDDRARASFTLTDRRGDREDARPVTLQFSGEHYVSNALAASAAALSLGASMEQVVDALRAATPQSRWRMEVSEAPGGITVINDTYNANPESMRAALKTLVAMGAGRRTWAVLGEMRELGDDALVEHDAIGRLAVRLDISRLVCVGPGTRVMHLAASGEGSWGDESAHVPDIDAAIEHLREHLRPGDVVLIKASRSVGLERIAEALMSGVTP